jgi:CheY-like chemotaxis protein
MSADPRSIESGVRVRPGRVLVVDDEAFVGNALAWSLTEHQVIAVASGKDALELLASGRRFDLVLSEVVMHGMNGIELLAELRRAFPAQAERVVFMTDRLVSPVVQRLLDGASNLCLERPFDMDGLRGLIDRRIRAVPGTRVA